MRIFQAKTSSSAEVPVTADDMVNKAYVDAQISTGTFAAPLFFNDVTPTGIGLVGTKTFHPNTVPANEVITEATTDNDLVHIRLTIEPGTTAYSPTVTITASVPANFNGGSPVVLNYASGLTRPTADRQFVGEFDATITGSVVLTAESTAGGTTTLTINRAGVGPAIQTLVLESESAQGAGRTHIKNGDTVNILSGAIENDAVSVELYGTASELISSDTPLTLGVVDSAGAGYKTITGSFVVSGASNGADRTVTARGANSFGTDGVTLETNGLDVDNNIPQFSNFAVSYPATQQAIKSGESATVVVDVTDATSATYSTPGGELAVNGGDLTTIETKQLNYVSGTYNVSVDNYQINATKITNGTVNTFAGNIKIAAAAPTAVLSFDGNPARLRSSPTGSNYSLRLNPNQELLNSPDALTVSGGVFTGGWGASGGDNWVRTLLISDGDLRGPHTLTSMTITGLAGLQGSVITSGDTYVIGGFTARVITVPAFAQLVPLGLQVGDVTKTVASYFEASSLTRQTDLSNQFQGYAFSTAGSAYDDTYPIYMWISDAAFAGSNTSGNLQIEIEELA